VDRVSHELRREGESEGEREARRAQDRERYHIAVDLHNLSLEEEEERIGSIRENETGDERALRLAHDAERHMISRELEPPSVAGFFN
jgi:hypothetical protein